MNSFRLLLFAACLLLLGFDLARDGSKQIRLRRGIENQKEELRRLRQDLSSIRSSYNSRLIEITWHLPPEEAVEPALVEEIATTAQDVADGSEALIPLNDHLNVERGQRN